MVVEVADWSTRTPSSLVGESIAVNVLVTGASRRIGRHVTERLLADGRSVRALVVPGDPRRSLIERPGVEFVEFSGGGGVGAGGGRRCRSRHPPCGSAHGPEPRRRRILRRQRCGHVSAAVRYQGPRRSGGSLRVHQLGRRLLVRRGRAGGISARGRGASTAAGVGLRRFEAVGRGAQLGVLADSWAAGHDRAADRDRRCRGARRREQRVRSADIRGVCDPRHGGLAVGRGGPRSAVGPADARRWATAAVRRGRPGGADC